MLRLGYLFLDLAVEILEALTCCVFLCNCWPHGSHSDCCRHNYAVREESAYVGLVSAFVICIQDSQAEHNSQAEFLCSWEFEGGELIERKSNDCQIGRYGQC